MEKRTHTPGSWESLSFSLQEQVIDDQVRRIRGEQPEINDLSESWDYKRAKEYVDNLMIVYLDRQIINLRDGECAGLPQDCVSTKAAEQWGSRHPLLHTEYVESRLAYLGRSKMAGTDVRHNGVMEVNGEVPEWFQEYADDLMETLTPEFADA